MPGPSVDLLAFLRPSQVSVTVAGQRFTLEAATASQWMGAIALDTKDLHGIVPGLIRDEDLDRMLEIASTHPDVAERWFWSARTALGRGAGRDWWWALNLSMKVLSGWMYFNGMLVRQGVDPKKVSYPDWLDACYTLLWSGADEEHRMKLDLELGVKPRGLPVAQSKATITQMLAEFAAD